MKKARFWLPLAVGVSWIGVGLRDTFAPGLFSFSGRVVSNSTMILDFVIGAIFLFVAFTFRDTKTKLENPLPHDADKS